MMDHATLLLRRTEIRALLSLPAAIDAMAAAFRAHHFGRSFAPQLMHLDADGGEFHVKGGGLRRTNADAESGTGRAYVALKANGGFFGNPARGLPSIQGLILLFDGGDGRLLAVFDSRDITAIRTGATTALAAKLLARPDATTLTLCGCGTQGRIHLEALTTVFPTLRKVHAWSRDPQRSAAFAQEASAALQLAIIPAEPGGLRAALAESDLVVTCTPAQKPLFLPGDVRPGTFIGAIGADSPQKQELDARLVAESRLVTDLLEQCAHVGELHHALDAGLMQKKDVHGELGAIVAGAAAGGWRPDIVTVFDSTGTALQDTAAAVLVYQAAQARGVGARLAFQT